FFFSSRRRHTRFSRDWSSDVCSSDLATLFTGKRERKVDKKPSSAGNFKHRAKQHEHKHKGSGNTQRDTKNTFLTKVHLCRHTFDVVTTMLQNGRQPVVKPRQRTPRAGK